MLVSAGVALGRLRLPALGASGICLRVLGRRFLVSGRLCFTGQCFGICFVF